MEHIDYRMFAALGFSEYEGKKLAADAEVLANDIKEWKRIKGVSDDKTIDVFRDAIVFDVGAAKDLFLSLNRVLMRYKVLYPWGSGIYRRGDN